MKYQTGIDAIRAIAIIAVLGYHGEMPGFGGGFVGVDVFFVISGYLMTSRILHDVQESNFSFVNYFERRLRRLIPALLLLVLAVLVVGSIVMFPDDLMAMASDVPWVLLFGANIVYWKTHDYFIAPPETLWLLHTWSLGVEEQAYVALPFLLVLVSRGPIMIKKIVLVSLIVMSFALVLVFGTTSPVATFYLLPTRFWEIACGALLAVLLGNRTPLRPPPQRRIKSTNQAFGWMGLSLIILSITILDEVGVWPSAQTALPVGGSLLLILAASSNLSQPKFMSNRVLVVVGRASYGTYLWHFPILMLFRYLSTDEMSLWERLLLVGPCSIGVGLLSNWLLERPVRDPKIIPRKFFYPAILISISTLLAVTFLIQDRDGLPGRFTGFQNLMLDSYAADGPIVSLMLEGIYRNCDLYVTARDNPFISDTDEWHNLDPECYRGGTIDRPKIFLWGDSHAAHLRPGLTEVFSSGWNIYQITTSGCAPNPNSDSSDLELCKTSNTLALRAISNLRPDVVVVAQGDWSTLSRNSIESRTSAIQKAGGRTVIQVGPVPNWEKPLPHIVIRQSRTQEDVKSFSDDGLVSDVLELDERLSTSVSEDSRFEYVSAIEWFCKKGKCLVYLGVNPIDGLTSFDQSHLTTLASVEFVKHSLGPAIREISTSYLAREKNSSTG